MERNQPTRRNDRLPHSGQNAPRSASSLVWHAGQSGVRGAAKTMKNHEQTPAAQKYMNRFFGKAMARMMQAKNAAFPNIATRERR